MSYCVHCGVELDATASFCPLCHTPVLDPNQPVDASSPKPFPTERKEVPPVSRWQLAILLTTVLVSIAACCGVLNFFLQTHHIWSLYVIGAVIMIWIWLVPPLLPTWRGLIRLQLFVDILAIAIYVLLIAVDLDGWNWYLHLALPLILLLGAVVLFLGLTIIGRNRSTLSAMTLVIGSIGLYSFCVELFADWFLHQEWSPSWSLIVLSVCIVLMLPLIVVRRVPSLREEVRRRFHR